jgi:hypothetical protein
MPIFNVLSGTWYHIEAPDLETAEEAYDAYFSDEDMPKDSKVVEGEVDSHWDWEDIDDKFPNKTTIKAMEEALEGKTTPEPPKGWVPPAW